MIKTIYIGGGTPSIVDSDKIAKIIFEIKNDFKLSKEVEITIEANPGTVTEEKIEKYIPSRVKESGNVEDFIIQCVQDYIRRERIKQERNSR